MAPIFGIDNISSRSDHNVYFIKNNLSHPVKFTVLVELVPCIVPHIMIAKNNRYVWVWLRDHENLH